MSYESKDVLVRNQELKVKELCVSSQEPGLYVDNGADVSFLINEAVARVLNIMFKDDSANTLIQYAASSISIVDSTAFTAGGDLKAIRLAGLPSIDANDLVFIKYVLVAD